MGKKILIVKNIRKDLGKIKTVLEKEGHEVVSAANGSDAMDILEKDGIDLILIDVKMKTLSTLDLLRLLRIIKKKNRS